MRVFLNSNKKFIKVQAFTLAEVLITLGIIGVVAALTIPIVVSNSRERATVSALKKGYSELSQAYTMAEQDYGTPDSWGLANNLGNFKIILSTYFLPYLKVGKNCIDVSNCFPEVSFYQLNGTDFGGSFINQYNTYPIFQLQDGSLIFIGGVTDPDCKGVFGTSDKLKSICATIMFDVNGPKNPNTMGIDTFYFWLTKSGIIPAGSSEETSYTFNSYCRDKTSTADQNGAGCAAWVIYNENMDYLKPCGPGLSWTGPIKCQ